MMNITEGWCCHNSECLANHSNTSESYLCQLQANKLDQNKIREVLVQSAKADSPNVPFIFTKLYTYFTSMLP